jgi:hypothetical protein
MSTTSTSGSRLIALALSAFLLSIAAASSRAEQAIPVYLAGSAEIPPVASGGTGTSQIVVRQDRTVSGDVVTSGIVSTVAHIHEAPVRKNGPPIITLTKTADNRFVVPDGTKLTDAQYASYLAGMLYVNVHSEQHPDGEIRGSLVSTELSSQ